MRDHPLDRRSHDGITVNANTGGGGALNNLQPYIALPYIIKY